MKNEVLNIIKALVENKQSQGFYPLHVLDIELFACVRAMLELLKEDGLIVEGDTISHKYYKLPNTEPPAPPLVYIANKIEITKRDPFQYAKAHRTKPAPAVPLAKSKTPNQSKPATKQLF